MRQPFLAEIVYEPSTFSLHAYALDFVISELFEVPDFSIQFTLFDSSPKPHSGVTQSMD